MIIDVNEMNGDDPNEIEHNHFFLMIFSLVCCLFLKLFLTRAKYYYFVKLC